MAEICKNCKYEIDLNFCSNCGQKKAKRIDRNYIKDEIQYTVLHMNKGFFYSIKKILRAPGNTAREFIEGNRVNHYKPILLLFVISGISAFLVNTYIHPMEVMSKFIEAQNQKTGFDQMAYYSFIFKYQSLVMVGSLPIMAFFTWIAFWKWGYNYYENIVLNAFCMISMQTLSILIVFPAQFLLRGNPDLFMNAQLLLTGIITFGITIWFFIEFYNNRSAGHVILRLILLGVSMLVLFMIAMIAIVFIAIAVNGIPQNVPH